MRRRRARCSRPAVTLLLAAAALLLALIAAPAHAGGLLPTLVPAGGGSGPASGPGSSPGGSPSPSPDSPSPASTPDMSPSPAPQPSPAPAPIEQPSPEPTDVPTETPTETPTDFPTEAPSDAPTEVPTETPTDSPTDSPSDAPTDAPSDAPTDAPFEVPTELPTEAPSEPPTEGPTEQPSAAPTDAPMPAPTLAPTAAPSPVASPPPAPVQEVLAPAMAPPAPPGTSTLGTAYRLIGTGLLPWADALAEFDAAYTALLARPNIDLGDSNVTYIGSVGVANGTAAPAQRRALRQAPARSDNVTVYYDVGAVPTSDLKDVATTLNASSTLAAFRTLLQQEGLDVSTISLVATAEGGITLTALAQAPAESGGSDGLSGGAIAGIVIAVVVGIAAILLLAYLCVYRARKAGGSDRGSPCGGSSGHAPYYVTPVGVRGAEPFDAPGGPGSMMSGSAPATNGSPRSSNGYSNAGYSNTGFSGAQGGYPPNSGGEFSSGPFPNGYSGPKDYAHAEHDSQAGAQEVAVPPARWNPAQRISSWWDERVRGQTTSNYGVRLGEPQQENFDPYAANIGESGASPPHSPLYNQGSPPGTNGGGFR